MHTLMLKNGENDHSTTNVMNSAIRKKYLSFGFEYQLRFKKGKRAIFIWN